MERWRKVLLCSMLGVVGLVAVGMTWDHFAHREERAAERADRVLADFDREAARIVRESGR